jgi:hypothetical protein
MRWESAGNVDPRGSEKFHGSRQSWATARGASDAAIESGLLAQSVFLTASPPLLVSSLISTMAVPRSGAAANSGELLRTADLSRCAPLCGSTTSLEVAAQSPCFVRSPGFLGFETADALGSFCIEPPLLPSSDAGSDGSGGSGSIGVMAAVAVAVLVILACLIVWGVVRTRKSPLSSEFELAELEANATTTIPSLFRELNTLGHIFGNPMTIMNAGLSEDPFTFQECEETLTKAI